MPSTVTSRLEGLTTSVAVKAPCRAATTAAITLSGLQTIDGIALASGDRVLVKDQADASENGIYVAGSGAWVRAKDFNGSLDIVQGTQVRITSGNTNVRSGWEVSSANPLVIGTSDIGFVRITYALVESGLEIFTPEQYGAAGDGVTLDRDALEDMAAAVSLAGGGIIEFGAGKTYLWGRQIESSNGRYLEGQPALHFDGVLVIINMNGATLKLASGFKFGSFNAATGEALAVTAPYSVLANSASLGRAILAENCPLFELRNGVFDMNSAGQTVGGEYGDTGWQLECYGVQISECDNVVVENNRVHDSLLDGFAYSHASTENGPSQEAHFRGNKAERCARNCFSLTGGKGLVFIGNTWSDAGECGGQSVSSPPRSCFDVEAEGTLIREIRQIADRFIAGALSLTCWVADSGDSAHLHNLGSTLDGPIWTSKPFTTFTQGCKVRGVFAKLYGDVNGENPEEATLVRGNDMTDQSGAGLSIATYTRFITTSGVAGFCRVEDNVIRLTKRAMQLGDFIVRRNHIYGQWDAADYPAGGQMIAYANSGTFEENVIYDETVGAPSSPYSVGIGVAAKIADTIVPGDDDQIRWGSSAGTSGAYYQGAVKKITEQTAPAVTYAAPAGGATIDAEGRASLAQLAVDVAAIRTKLSSAGVTA